MQGSVNRRFLPHISLPWVNWVKRVKNVLHILRHSQNRSYDITRGGHYDLAWPPALKWVIWVRNGGSFALDGEASCLRSYASWAVMDHVA